MESKGSLNPSFLGERLGLVGLTGEIGAMVDGILFHGGMTCLDERGCIVTSGRKTIVFARFMIFGLVFETCVGTVADATAGVSDTW